MADERDVKQDAEALAASDSEAVAAGDAKARFREALERKKQAQANRPSTPGAGAVGIGAHSKAGGKREFRRKSG